MGYPKIIAQLIFLASLPPLYFSITSSGLLLNYENVTKKAASFSAEARRQLHKTRTTQAAAVMASLASTISALCLGVSASSTVTVIVLAVGNAAASAGARQYVGNFWGGARKVTLPGSREYNDAIRDTERALGWLGGLAVAWVGYAGYIGVTGI